MAENVKEYFQIVDFIVCFGFMGLSLVVGSFFALRDRKKKSTENYYFGEKKLSPVAVAMSISVSYISAVTVIGVPADVYLHGTSYALHPLTVLIVDIIAIAYYIPLFHRLKLLSLFEYLEMRFHRSVRMIVSGLEMMSLVVYASVVTYLPALALQAVTPLDLNLTIFLTSTICIVYTSLGGMKAVIWTDVIQAFVMIGGLLVVFFATLYSVGGFEAVTESVERGGRNTIFKLDADPRVKNTMFSILFGTMINSFYTLICNQSYVQRWRSCSSVKDARIALAISFIPLTLLNLFSVLVGMAVYAYYEGCDPLTLNKVARADQIVPHMVVYIFRNMPGMSGLFVSAAFCGTLSTVSSAINALAAMALSDFVGIWFPMTSQKRSILISKVLSIGFGILIMVISYLISLSSMNALAVVLMVSGIFAGPIVALFVMGVFMPWINYKGAMIGCCFGFAFSLWIAISSMVVPIDDSRWEALPLSVGNCSSPDYNFTISAHVTQTESTSLQDIGVLGSTLFAISPYFYGLLGTVSGILVSHIASIFTGFENPSDEIRSLSVPIVRWSHAYPSCLRNYFVFHNESKNEECDITHQKEHLNDESSPM